MTPSEFDLIRAAIKSAYPTFNIMPDKYSIQLWYRMLGDIEFKICETALQELIATQTYPPQIAEIRAKCAEYMSPGMKDAGEAWGDVQRAIQKYGYYRSDEAIQSLSGSTREAVERMGFRELCLGDNPVANRAHFFKVYDAIIQRKLNERRIPEPVLQKRTECMLNCAEQEKPSVIEKKAQEETLNVSTPEFIDRLMREKGLR